MFNKTIQYMIFSFMVLFFFELFSFCFADGLTINTGAVVTVSNDTEISSNQDIIISGSMINQHHSRIFVKGNLTIQNGASFIPGLSHVTLNGTQQQALTSSNQSFFDLTINNTTNSLITLNDNLFVKRDLTMSNGQLQGGSRILYIGRHWLNQAGNSAFSSGTSTVDFTGDGSIYAQNITANGADFYVVKVSNTHQNGVTFQDTWSADTLISNTPNAHMKFIGGGVFTISGALTLDGSSSGTEVTISSTNTTPFILNLSNEAYVRYVNVSYAQANLNNIFASFSIDRIGNDTLENEPHWVFSSVSDLNRWTGGEDASGWQTPENWSANVVPQTKTDKVYINQTDHQIATATSNDILYLGDLETTSGFSGQMTFHQPLVITSDEGLYGTLKINGGAFILTNKPLTIDGEFYVGSSASFNAGTALVTLQGPSVGYLENNIDQTKTEWNAGSFLNIQSDLNQTLPSGEDYGSLQLGRFSSDAQQTIYQMGSTINGDWIIDADAVVYLTDNVELTGDLYLYGTLNAGAYDLTITGNWHNQGSFVPATGSVIFNGTTVFSGLSNMTFNRIVINPNAEVFLDKVSLVITSSFNHQGTLVFDGNEVVLTGSMTDQGTMRFIGMSEAVVSVDLARRMKVNNVWKTTFNRVEIAEENVVQLRDIFLISAHMTVSDSLHVLNGNVRLNSNVLLTVSTDFSIYNGNILANDGALSVKDFSLYGGEFHAPLSGKTFNVSGNFSRLGGVFYPYTGRVTLTGSDQTLKGSTTFYDLMKNTPGGVLRLESGDVFTITTLLTLQGSLASPLMIVSTLLESPSYFSLSQGGGQSISNVQVQDNDASASSGLLLYARGVSSSLGRTQHWVFGETDVVMKWTGDVDTLWSNPRNWHSGAIPDVGDKALIRYFNEDKNNQVIINQPVLNMNVQTREIEIRDAAATLNLSGFALNIDTLTNTGTLQLRGSESVHIQHMDVDSGYVHYLPPAGTFNITQLSNLREFYILYINPTSCASVCRLKIDEDIVVRNSFKLYGGSFDAQEASLQVQGGFYADAGTEFMAPQQGEDFLLSGEVYIQGDFVHNQGKMTLNQTSSLWGTSQNVNIQSSIRLSTFEKQIPSGALQAHSLTIQSMGLIEKELILRGQENNYLVIQSQPQNVIRKLTLLHQGLQDIQYVDVSHSNAFGYPPNDLGLTLFGVDSIDSGNNTNWVFGSASLVWTGAVSYDWNERANWDLGRVPIEDDRVTIPKTSRDPILNQDVSLKNLFIEEDVNLTLNGYGLIVTDTFSNEGNIYLRGDEDIVIEHPDIDSGKWTYLGDLSGEVTIAKFSPSQTKALFYDLTIYNTSLTDVFSLPVDIDLAVYGDFVVEKGRLDFSDHDIEIDGSIYLLEGQFLAPLENKSFIVKGSWFNEAQIFEHQQGRVTFSPFADQPITLKGETSFYDVMFDVPQGGTILFDAGKTQTILNRLLMSESTDQALVLRSTQQDISWMLKNTLESPFVVNVDVRDAVAVDYHIYALNSVDQKDSFGVSTNNRNNPQHLWVFYDLRFFTPVDDSLQPRQVGKNPVLIGQGPVNETIVIKDDQGNVVATVLSNQDGNFRVTVGDALAPDMTLDVTELPLGQVTLYPYVGTLQGSKTTINVVENPSFEQVPQITHPLENENILSTSLTLTGLALPGALVDVVLSNSKGVDLTMPPQAYAATGVANEQGQFSIPLEMNLLAGRNEISVIVNGVSSAIHTAIVNTFFGFVFDSITDTPIENAQVSLYVKDQNGIEVLANQENAALHVDDVNPFITGADGFYYFFEAQGDFRMEVSALEYEYPTQKTNEELPSSRHVVLGSRGESMDPAQQTPHIDHPMDVQASLFRITKKANKKEVYVGDVVTYTLEIENLSATTVSSDVILEDIIPPGFKFMSGRVLLDKLPTVNPTGQRPLIFSTGSYASKQKKVLKYQLVVGAGVTHGTYDNKAQMKYLNGEKVSNLATESVKVVMDPLFDMGGVFGKVFHDINENGIQDAPYYSISEQQDIVEGPIPHVKLMMEDGTIVTTDAQGLFHISGLLPGRHLLRVDERTLPKGMILTTPKVQIFDITQGSSVKINFGVIEDVEQQTSASAQFFNDKVRIDRQQDKPKPRLNVDMFNDAVLMSDGLVLERVEFRIFTNYAPFIKTWTLDIQDADTARLVKRFEGEGIDIYEPILWDGKDEQGRFIDERKKYAYVLKAQGVGLGGDETKLKTISIRVLNEKERIDYDHQKTRQNNQQQEEKNKRYAKWLLTQEYQNILHQQTIPIKGETIKLDPVSVQLKQVRVLKEDRVFLDWPIRTSQEVSARNVLENLLEQQPPMEMILPDGDYQIDVVSVDVSQEERYRQDIRVGDDYFMFVALGDGKIGYNVNRGNIEAVKKDDRYKSGFYHEGKMAYYLKGKIKGKYLITSSFDSERDQKEMFRGLDQDAYYPVYGDESSVNYDATNTQGSLYLLVEWDKSQAVWGNYVVDFKDTEFAKYSRTLYGGKLDYTSVATTPYGAPRTKMAVFHAQVKQRTSHNEFLATGGSLYYLKHQKVIQGTEKISLEVRDAVTGQVRSKTSMTSQADYQIDYSQGRILFWQPVSMSISGGSIINDGLLNGDPIYVVVDYEYETTDDISESTQGARLAQAVGDRLVLGGTYVKETQADKEYVLQAQDVTIQVGPDAVLKGEYAQTQSKDAGSFMSTNGGISFDEIQVSQDQGKAYGLRYDARMFHRLGFSSYYKWADAGFSVAGASSSAGKELKGFQMVFDLTPLTRLTASYDIQKLIEQGNLTTQMQVGAQETRTTALQLVHEAKRLRLTAEYRKQEVSHGNDLYQSVSNRGKDVIALQIQYMLNEKTDLLFKHQMDVVDGQAEQSDTIGLTRQLTRRLKGTFETTISDDGTLFKSGLSANVTPKMTLMADYGITALKTGENLNTATVGVKGQVNEKTMIQTTYGMTQTKEGDARAVASLTGYTQVDDTSLKASLETGADQQGVQRESILLGMEKQQESGATTSTDIRMDDTVDGQASHITMSESGAWDNGVQFTAEKTLVTGTEGGERGEYYKLIQPRQGLKTETSLGRKYAFDQYEQSHVNIFGLSGDINDRWALSSSIQKGTVQHADGRQSDRVAASVGVGFVQKDIETGKEVLKSSTKLEIRQDRGEKDEDQYVVYQAIEGKLTENLTMSLNVEMSETKDKDTRKIEEGYKKIVLGAAYRPIDNDRFNMFTRYTYKSTRKPEDQESQEDIERTRMHVFSLDASYDINEKWQLVERIALRIMEEKVEDFDFSKTHTWLLINRLNYRLSDDWKIGTEYRILKQQEAKDQKQGFLIEAVRGINEHVEIGLGYNFTDFVDDLTNLDYNVAGPFIRMTGKFYDRTPEEKARAKAKWRERRVDFYARKMVQNTLKKKDHPIILELNKMYQMAHIASDLGLFEDSRMIYKDIILVLGMMFEEAAEFVREQITFEETLYQAFEKAKELYAQKDYEEAKKIWEKILEEAQKAVLQ